MRQSNKSIRSIVSLVEMMKDRGVLKPGTVNRMGSLINRIKSGESVSQKELFACIDELLRSVVVNQVCNRL